MKKLAVTGNIGSGKTSCCRILEIWGYPVYYADQKAKWLMENNTKLQRELVRAFGPKAYSGQKLNRTYLARRVFTDAEALRQLNSIVHPAVHKDMMDWMIERQKEGYGTAIEEAALTFEAGHQSSFDYTITVAAPASILIDRVVKRDNSNKKDVQDRLDHQMSQKEKCQQSDGIILNDGQHSLIFQLQNIITRWELSLRS